ncbi:MAG: amidohydrolase family protein [Microvirga sp.]
MIDAYAHVGMPRFQTVEDHRATMARLGIAKSLVCAFDSCTDLGSVHRAITEYPAEFRGLGLALGRDRAQVEQGIALQVEAGFVGLRLNVSDVRDRPWLLETLADLGAFPLVVGEAALSEAAPALLRYLDATPDGLAVGGHFAGPTDPGILERPGPARDLFRHPRFAVVLSRQGIFQPPLIEAWAGAVLAAAGWERVMWGTEAPVLYWRDEPIRETPGWIDRFAPDAGERQAFFSGNAQRLIFDRPAAPPSPLRLPFDPFDFEIARPVPMWPFGLPVHTNLPGRMIHGWIAWGGEERGPLSTYLGELLDSVLPEVADDA